MDENYLDNLLNEFTLDKEIDNKIEDELDDQIAKEKQQFQKENTPSQEDLFKMDLEQDAADGLLDQDISFSEEQMDELDALDELADLDIGDLDFSDIDFDDLDITKLDDVDTSDIDDLLKDFEGDLEIDDAFNKEDTSDSFQSTFNEESTADAMDHSVPQQDELNEDTFDADGFLDSLMQDEEKKAAEETPIVELENDNISENDSSGQDSSGQDSMEELSDGDLDALLNALSEDSPGYDAMEAMDGFSDFGKVEETEENHSDLTLQQTLSEDEEGNLDDLFSLLDLDETEQDEVRQVQEGQSELADKVDEPNQLSEHLKDTVSAKKQKKKKSFMDILFGEDDEELTEEQIADLEAKKAEKKAEKKAKKQAEKEAKKEKSEAAKAEKEQKQLQKKKADAEKQKVKAEKKAKQKALDMENAEPEKKLNGAMVVFVFTLFLGGTFVLYLAANNFNYIQVIQKATDYFESQKYHKAYDEIKGVDVKEKDQDLKDRIYTVMYVERLYESYENNMELGFYDKALDSLLRGVDKYYEHYDEAVELGIVSDIDFSFSRIQDTLVNNFGISVEKAVEINKLDDDEYVLTIRSYVDENKARLLNFQSSEGSSDKTATPQKEDAISNKQQDASEE